MAITWTKDTRVLDAIIANLDKKASDAVQKIATDVSAIAVERAGKDEGELIGSIEIRKPGPLERVVWVGAEHGIYQELGTGIHAPGGRGAYPIVPKEKKALWWPGLPHPIASVPEHPGNPPKPFLGPACEEVRPRLPEYFKGVFA